MSRRQGILSHFSGILSIIQGIFRHFSAFFFGYYWDFGKIPGILWDFSGILSSIQGILGIFLG